MPPFYRRGNGGHRRCLKELGREQVESRSLQAASYLGPKGHKGSSSTLSLAQVLCLPSPVPSSTSGFVGVRAGESSTKKTLEEQEPSPASKRKTCSQNTDSSSWVPREGHTKGPGDHRKDSVSSRTGKGCRRVRGRW